MKDKLIIGFIFMVVIFISNYRLNAFESRNRDLEVIYEEDFETGADGWSTLDPNGTGDLWHLAEDHNSPGNVYMGCFDEATSSYLPFMVNYIISPELQLPQGYAVYWDINMRMALDEGVFPERDYLMVEIRFQIEDGIWTNWRYVSNPFQEPGGNNIVYTGSTLGWEKFSESWGMAISNISELAGRTIQFRFGLHSNGFDQPVPGYIKLDDFTVYKYEVLPAAPLHLISEVTDDNEVQLNWDAIVTGGESGWLGWDNGQNNNALGLPGSGTFKAAIRFEPQDLMPYSGGYFDQFECYISDSPSEMNFCIWKGVMAEELVYCQTFEVQHEQWNLLELEIPIYIQENFEYWIGVEAEQDSAGYTLGVDSGSGENEKGDWMVLGEGNWFELAENGIDVNWNFHVNIESAGGTREVSNYNVWRSDGDQYELIGSTEPDEIPEFIDHQPIIDNWNYYSISAVYEGVESDRGRTSELYIFGEDNVFLGYDDGSAETGYNGEMSEYAGVRFTPESGIEWQLSHFKIYMDSLNTSMIVLRILPEIDQQPGQYIAQINLDPAGLQAGWNLIFIPEEDQEDLIFSDESFYIAYFATSNISSMGIDTDNSGQSWITEDGNWTELVTGNLMIQAILKPQMGDRIYGDLDGNYLIDSYDGALLLREIVGIDHGLSNFPIFLADVDGDGDLSAYDASLILQHSVELINLFPVER